MHRASHERCIIENEKVKFLLPQFYFELKILSNVVEKLKIGMLKTLFTCYIATSLILFDLFIIDQTADI